MNRALIICAGFFGDHLFSLPIAEHLIVENQFDAVDYVIGWPQLLPFFQRHPFIGNVLLAPHVGPVVSRPPTTEHYTKEFYLQPISRTIPPTVELQQQCGVRAPSSDLTAYHIKPNTDIRTKIDSIRQETGAPVLAIMENWRPKAFSFTKEEYWRGCDIPFLGYGGKLRNIDHIIHQLGNRYNILMVGSPANINQFTMNYTGPSLLETAEMLNECDYYIGPEGGLANLACAMGTQCIIESNFVAQLYGPNGIMQKCINPQLGPHIFNPGAEHSFLNPYLTDDELVNKIIEIIDTETPSVFDWAEV